MFVVYALGSLSELKIDITFWETATKMPFSAFLITCNSLLVKCTHESQKDIAIYIVACDKVYTIDHFLLVFMCAL